MVRLAPGWLVATWPKRELVAGVAETAGWPKRDVVCATLVVGWPNRDVVG